MEKKPRKEEEEEEEEDEGGGVRVRGWVTSKSVQQEV